ncbi:hypothetical protein MCOR27_001224 [Pyricularia oryzae]|uniref:Uncharacterized protein n=2 Tax=Pyricularia TaxID=48558 RepID=A0ABQ8N432_PYRGI|nr:hypothetical protein MCOR01_008181 [Pyricularia oryzae]KAI6290942.1 hypothetical protein MCOR33_010947 [Pyricularia grisea]KAH9438770.1 hypothetical protein MCOR02_002372 [Pyricularia oryzae]KAI6256256.1 hypothetical protein MCOR19_007259 [Pyricularia oryzae]KAI6270642.1 hypothetical protein MCOR26_008148 [Pyricularia oryzae]
MAAGTNSDVDMPDLLDLVELTDEQEPEDTVPAPWPPNTPPPPYVGSAQTPAGLPAISSSPQSPEAETAATQSGLDLAVQYLLPAGIRGKDALDAKILQRMDTKYVQTVSGEMITGDTLILINVPRGHLPNRTCTGSSYPYQYRIRICSSKLRSCGFDLFPRLLDDEKYQAKTFRRFAAKQTRPPDVTYILDLGPSTDEDLQSTQLETLSLSRGLIRWYKAAKVPPFVNPEVVAGHDDCCECADIATEEPVKPPAKPTVKPIVKDEDGKGSIWDSQVASPEYRNIEDYCEVRHAANVVRLLRAIAEVPGCRLPLNSAPRAFTIAGLAKLFELNLSDQSSWLQNDMLSWFTADKNSYIMEILTEESIIMAYNLKISKVARATYRLLVSEHALQLESRLPTQRGGHHFSVFGRLLKDINDDAIQTAVEHGGQALSERVLGIVQHLESDDALGWLGMKEWRDLEVVVQGIRNHTDSLIPRKTDFDSESVREAFAALKMALLKIIRWQLADATNLNCQITTERYIENLSYYASPGHTVEFNEIWNNLNKRQKQLTAVFWENLERRWPYKIDIMAERINLQLLAKRLNMAIGELTHPDVTTGHENWPRHWYYRLNIELLITQLYDSLQFNVCEPLRGQGVIKPENSELQLFSMSSHLLVGLDEDEMRFLPLWADGLNDGSGGVYISTIPPDMSDTAPIQPGPGYVTGHSRATEATNSTVGDLELDNLDIRSIATMTETNAAGRATCSTIAPSSQVGGSEDLDFQNARYTDPAEHQPVSVGVFGLVDTFDEEYQDEDFDSCSNSTAQNTPTASVTGTDTESRSSDWVMT